MSSAIRPPQDSTLLLSPTRTSLGTFRKLTTPAQERLVIFTVLALIGILYSFAIREGLPWGDDYALYFAHAQNLATGQPYSATGYVFNPAEPEIGPPAYPPLFPLLLAPVFRLTGFNPQLIKAEGVLFFLAALWAIYRYLRHFLPAAYIVAILILIGLSPYDWKYLTNTPSSDPFFVCLLFVFLERSLVASRGQWKKLSDAFVIGILLYLCCACRTIGVILFPCLIASELLNTWGSPPRKLWLSVAVGALGVGIQAWVLPGQKAYLSMMNFHVPILVEYAKGHVWSVRYQLLAVPGVSGWILLLALAVLGLLGFVVTLGAGVRLSHIFTISYLGVIGTVDPDLRYLLPVIPLWLLDCCTGILWLRQRSDWSGAKPLAAAIAATIAILYCPHIGRAPNAAVPDLRTTGTNNQGFQKTSKFIRENTPPGSRIVFSKPKLLAFFTGRQCAVYPKTNAQAIVKYLQSIHADYLVMSSAFESDRTLLFPLARTNPHLLEPIFEADDAAVYRTRYAK